MKRTKSFTCYIQERALPIDNPDKAGQEFADILAKNYPVKEIPKGKNHGKDVDRYVNTAGLNNQRAGKALPNTGYPWCMAFVYTMHNDLCKSLGIANTLPKTAGVLKHWDRSDSSVKISISDARNNPSLVKPGQVFIMTRKGSGLGHTGIVTSVNVENKTFKTIEGNTNDAKSGEGHRVGMHNRKLSQSSLVGFTDYFKGSRTKEFENAISTTVANAPSDYSPETQIGSGGQEVKGLLIAIGGKNYSGEKLKQSISKSIQDSWEVVSFNSHDCGGKEKVASSKEIIEYIETARKNGIGLVYLTGYSLGGLLVFKVAQLTKVDRVGLIDPSIPKSFSISNFPTEPGSVIFMYGSPGMAKYYNDGRWEQLSKQLTDRKQIVERIEQGHFEFPGQFYKKYVKVRTVSTKDQGNNVSTNKNLFGSTTSEVKEIQMALVQKGYPLPKYGVDGQIGSETRGQIEKFQKDNDLPVTGEVDSQTAEVLTGRSKSTSTKRSSARYKLKKFEIWDREEKRVLYFIKLDRKDVVQYQVKARGGKDLGICKMENNKIFLQETDVTEKSWAKIIVNYFNHWYGTSSYTDDTKYIVRTGESSITHNYTGDAAKNISLLEATAKKHGITNPNTLIGFLSVIGKETSFIPKNEYSYSGTGISRLRHLFGGPLKHLSDQEVLELRKNDVAFYDVTYGHIGVKNGYHTWNNKADDPVLPGDGYKYRGRGFNQVTFKQSYKKYAKITGVDIVNNPDKLNNVNVAAEVAVLFLLNRLKSKNIDPNSFQTADEAVQMCARANAGWGKDASRQIASARQIEKRLDIKTTRA